MLLVRYPFSFFSAYLLVSIGLLIVIETPFNEAVGKSAAWTAIPIGILSIAFTLRYFDRIRLLYKESPSNIWFSTILTAGILIFLSWPYSLFVNAKLSKSTEVLLGGVVQEKFESGSRSRSFVLVTSSGGLNSTYRLQVPEQVYRATNIGAEYHHCFFRGSLGFYYRWRYSEAQPTCKGQRGAT
jgi:hypothetical protein